MCEKPGESKPPTDENQNSTEQGKTDINIAAYTRVAQSIPPATPLTSPLKVEVIDGQSEEQSTESTDQAISDAARRRYDLQTRSINFDIYLRITYAIFLAALLTYVIYSDNEVMWAVGLKYLDYTKYPRLIDLMLGQHFLEVAGFVFVVVRYLFPNAREEHKEASLWQRILEKYLPESKPGTESSHRDEL